MFLEVALIGCGWCLWCCFLIGFEVGGGVDVCEGVWLDEEGLCANWL